jgi:hypothetical protein
MALLAGIGMLSSFGRPSSSSFCVEGFQHHAGFQAGTVTTSPSSKQHPFTLFGNKVKHEAIGVAGGECYHTTGSLRRTSLLMATSNGQDLGSSINDEDEQPNAFLPGAVAKSRQQKSKDTRLVNQKQKNKLDNDNAIERTTSNGAKYTSTGKSQQQPLTPGMESQVRRYMLLSMLATAAATPFVGLKQAQAAAVTAAPSESNTIIGMATTNIVKPPLDDRNYKAYTLVRT